MNDNSRPRPLLSPEESATMLARSQQVNPHMFTHFKAMNLHKNETANEHLLAAARSSVHGHSHTYSPSCKHFCSSIHFSQPAPKPAEKPPVIEMTIVQAVQYNEIERVKQLIESGQANVNQPDNEGCYLLHWASINNHVELVRYLIAKGATVNIIGGDLKSSPLHWACM